MIQPPPGFQLDKNTNSSPPPPPGFELDQSEQPQQPQGMWDKTKGLYDSFQNSPITQTIQAASPVGVLNYANNKMHEGYNMMGEKATEAIGGSQKFPSILKPYQNQIAAGVGTGIQITPDAAMSVAPMLGKSVTSQAPNWAEELGARGINHSAGIKPTTLEGMSQGGNPGEAGTKLGMSLFKEGAIGNTASSTFSKSKALLGKYGEDVGNAMSDIKGAGGSTEAADYEVLQPLHDEITRLKGSVLQSNRVTAKPFQDVYNKLVNVANDNQGNIGIEHIQDAMKETGEALGNAGEGTPKEAALSKLYGALAKVRDSIVQKIADASGNDQLGGNLLKANAGYSKYSRIMPDINRAASKAAVSSPSILTPLKTAAKAVEPLVSKAAMGAGQALREVPSISQVAATALPLAGQPAPHGKVVEQDGKRYQWDGFEYVAK